MDGSFTLWVVGAAICLPTIAGCRASDRPTQSRLSAAAVAGCYQFAHADGRALNSPSGFWSAPVRLDTTLALLDGDGDYHTEPGTFIVVPTGPIVAAEAMDTALMRSRWELLSPDTVRVIRTDGFIGQAIQLRPQGVDFVGVERWFSDVVDTTRPPQENFVRARRVPCPPS